METKGYLRRGGAILAALALSVLSPGVQAEAKSQAASPILAKPEQRTREAQALRIYRSAAFQAELAKAKVLFAQSPIAQIPDGRATIDRVSEALAFSSAMFATNFDAVRPNIMWGTNAARRWMGLSLPSSGYGLDSPDNVYRSATFDGAGRYVVRGTIHGTGPAQQTFVVYRGPIGLTETMAGGRMVELAGIKSEDIVRDTSGNFTLTIDAEPANGRANHMQVPREIDSLQLTIRDSLADWTRELPVELTIERLDTPAIVPPARSEEEMIALAIRSLQGSIPFWIGWAENYMHSKPINEIPQPWYRAQGWGMTQQGRFSFAQDEAWLITLDPKGAKFFDMQISDPWSKAVEYVSRTGSFNASQAIANPDGTITMVAAPRDPGVHNWLDTSGLIDGTFQARWQSLPPGTTAEGAVREARIVKLTDLKANLPEGTRFVTPKERKAQLRERAASYARRLR
jgi:hypothetical protein